MNTTISRKKLAELHVAAKKIEVDGFEAFRTASEIVGEEVALALLVTHLRRAFGSMETYPPEPEIEEEVNIALFKLGFWMVE